MRATAKGSDRSGGGVKFLELTGNALRREMREELACKIRVDGGPHIFESMYTHHGASGHEIIFALRSQFLEMRSPHMSHSPWRKTTVPLIWWNGSSSTVF